MELVQLTNSQFALKEALGLFWGKYLDQPGLKLKFYYFNLLQSGGKIYKLIQEVALHFSRT